MVEEEREILKKKLEHEQGGNSENRQEAEKCKADADMDITKNSAAMLSYQTMLAITMHEIERKEDELKKRKHMFGELVTKGNILSNNILPKQEGIARKKKQIKVLESK